MTTPSAVSRPSRPGPSLVLSPVIEAARAAPNPAGPVRWFARVLGDGIEFRSVVRRWSTADEPTARSVRVAAGAALRNARLAMAVQGRRPLVSFPSEQGLLAVVRAGVSAPPRAEERLLHAVLVTGATGEAGAGHAAERDAAALTLVRRAAEAEGGWLRVLAERPTGLRRDAMWSLPVGVSVRGSGQVVLVGADGPGPAAELRLGQALQGVRLTAMALGFSPRVLAAPAPVGLVPAALRSRPAAGSCALLELVA
ncbi:MAG: hypothetical protein OJJ54_08560 [Pseudonocardia sp.]|nr:hypothetical protein [Pseudonocardia sp.]